MTKKVLSLIFAVFMSFGILAGCNLVKFNTENYYSQVVATVEYDQEKLSFTMKDLLTAYQNYGSQYTQQGSTVEEAVNSSLTTLINRAVLVKELKKVPLTADEINSLKHDVYDNMNNAIAEIETTIRKEWKLEVEEGDEQEDVAEQPLRTAYAPYEAKFELRDGSLARLVAEQKTLNTEPAGNFKQVITDVEVSQEAWKRYLRQLKDAAKIEGVTKLTDAQLIDREIKRIYDVLEENEYVTKFQTDYLNSLAVSTSEVVARYKELYLEDYIKYVGNTAAYHKDIRSGFSEVYYHPVVNQYLKVSHILIQLSDEQNAQIDTLNKRLKANSISKEQYDYEVERIRQDQTVVKYNTASGAVAQKSLPAVHLEIVSAVEQYGKLLDNSLQLRAKEFNSFIYKYNDDPGIMNADYPYVVNLYDIEGVDNAMIPEFIEGARELYFNPEKGTGSVSEPVLSEYESGKYGFHIIMNLGTASNLVEMGEIGNITWQALYRAKTQPSGEKSVFEVLYDAIDLDSSKASKRIGEIVDNVKREGRATIKLYPSVYKNLWKS